MMKVAISVTGIYVTAGLAGWDISLGRYGWATFWILMCFKWIVRWYTFSQEKAIAQ